MTELRKVTQLAWRRLLISEHGVEGLLVLRENMPHVGKGESHNIIFDAGRVAGYREALDALDSLIAADKPKQENLENP